MEPVTSAILKNFLSQLGERLPAPASLYLLGGSALGMGGQIASIKFSRATLCQMRVNQTNCFVETDFEHKFKA
jgi:hypothetical protein